ncbi:hypothetical protein [Mannheimia granulomatis]|uniref:hypothetical protein n=1 Tax=Mannheimia granulomatis TaxID=85402 RepID=UPI00047EB42F|nr:hypothetical protein [Mannheimia granulomatis]QLB19420.1 hypothetical protein A6B41_08160 [Mannheimia granulomatis]
MTILPNVYDKLFPLGDFDNIKDYFEYFIFEKNTSFIDDKLYNSVERKKWLKHYPSIEQYPNLISYIQDENSVSLSLISEELSETKLYLPLGETIFHSGSLPNGIDLSIGESFSLKEVFSSTLDPYIANVHDGDDDIYWLITIKDDSIRCFPVPDEYGEMEIIILDSPRAEIIGIEKRKRARNWNGYDSIYDNEEKTIIYIDLYKQ